MKFWQKCTLLICWKRTRESEEKMFENKFVNDLTIIKSDGSVILTKAIVAHEEVQRLDGFDSDVSNSFAFVLEVTENIDVFDRIKYREKIFEIKSIALIESLDRKKSYYKIKIV